MKPYVHMMVVACSDVSMYKKDVRPRVKTWVAAMGERGCEWLVAHVSNRKGDERK